ncbi:hypothetical protein H4R34_000447 [Dimargaris verticillata]|uniref:Centromere protein H C-terminal domain-containing protein n=1 Tax=Dimargaris verticillata TaxID=2761393 RepID=A0A9W8BD90_9FUNG|nr:hypothetical protein H4R34_000447 [Dimargaris verticillata]
MTTFADLTALADTLLHTVLQAPVDVKPWTCRHGSQPLSRADYDQYCTAQATVNQRNRQEEIEIAQDLEAYVHQQPPVPATADNAEALLQQTIDSLKKELAYQVARHQLQTTIQSNLTLAETVTQVATVPPNDRRHDERTVAKAIIRRDELSIQLAQANHALSKLNDELYQVEAEIRQRHQQNQVIMTQVQALRQDQSTAHPLANDRRTSKQLRQLDTEQTQLTSRLHILQNVLQGLILESGLNWAQDKQLREMMRRLGEME